MWSIISSTRLSGDPPVVGSLRQAVELVNADGGGSIVFDDHLFKDPISGVSLPGQGTIYLTGGELSITAPVTILGPGPAALTISNVTGGRPHIQYR